MKKLIYFFALLCSVIIFGQSDNFYNPEKSVKWERITYTQLNFDQLLSEVKNSGRFYDIEQTDNKIIARFKDLIPKYREAGFTLLGTNAYLTSGVLAGSVVIDFKEGKYRFTVNNVKIRHKVTTLNYSMVDQTTGLEDVALNRNGDFRKGFFNKDSKIFDYTFTQFTTFKQAEKPSDNW